MLFDSHCHLSHTPLVENLPEILAQAAAREINGFLVPSTQPQDWQSTIQLVLQYPHIYGAIGIHPWFISAYNNYNLNKLEQLLYKHPQLLIGEIGLDFARAQESTCRELQIHYFEEQLCLAQSMSRPIIVHHVHATSACIQSIKRCAFSYGGFAHAFSGSIEEANEWIKLGFFIGIGSLLLHPHAKKVRIIAQNLPLQNIVIETDAPYMAPPSEPYNTPNNIIQIAKIIADLRGCHWQDIAQITTQNTEKILSKINN